MIVVAEDPDHLEARLRLANVLEEKGDNAEALEIVTDGRPYSPNGADNSTPSTSTTRSSIQIPAQSV
jgi:hypothetical protein